MPPLFEITIAAFIGAMLTSLQGWAGQGGPFAPRKMLQSAIAGLLSAAVFAVGYQMADTLTARDILLAMLSGAGMDNVVNRAGPLATNVSRKPIA